MRASTVIGALSEARHPGDLPAMIGCRQAAGTRMLQIHSGSTDGTLEIERPYGARSTMLPKAKITKSEVSFGSAIDRGCTFATGDVPIRPEYMGVSA